MKACAHSLALKLTTAGLLIGALWQSAMAFDTPAREPLPDVDVRKLSAGQADAWSAQRAGVLEALAQSVNDVKVSFEPLSGSPISVGSTSSFLTGPGGEGKAVQPATLARFATTDPYRTVKAFMSDQMQLFGYGPEVLEGARVSRDYVTAYNGMRTIVWEQQVQGIRIYEGLFLASLTKAGELINISSRFIPGAERGATNGTPNSPALAAQPPISAAQAIALAAQDIGVAVTASDLSPQGNVEASAEQRQIFRGPGLKGDAEAKLMWFALDRDTLKLCWDVLVMSRERGEMYRSLLDISSGQILRRQCLTRYLSDASYRVWTSDSPSPFSPGLTAPGTYQPPLVARTLVTLSALDTNASPAGWINDGVNETLGNNVDAHTDRNADNQPDMPRPHGSPFRVFDFPADLGTQDPTVYSNAAVVQLFYLCNWYHDKTYELGFTEAAGNFQGTNFGRGGLGNDPVQADAQDGSGYNNANFSTPPDGSSGRMQMYLFTGPTPRRDGDLDAEVVFHEHTHGLSWRMVGGGQALGTLQSDGMGEGWSDFYALALLSEAGDDVNGNYTEGGYVSYKLTATFLQNYYFGIRRYPYTTDMSKNPLTFKDIDPAQADYCSSGAPFTSRMSCTTASANEVHNSGEVWCVTLWEARANLIEKYGWAVGNQLILQLVTDAMKLTAAEPNFLQARDAILQADNVDTGGANRNELWAAFAKRGIGASATSPLSSTTTGVHEAFDIPDDLSVNPGAGFTSSGQVGGPFTPNCQGYLLRNTGAGAIGWVASVNQTWLSITPANGSLGVGESNVVNVCLTADVNSFAPGSYSANVRFSNTVSHVVQNRSVSLYISPPRALFFPLDTDPGWVRQGQWQFGQPTGAGGTAHGFHDPSAGFTGTNVFGVNINGDYSITVGGPYYLTTGPLDLSGYTGVVLQFKRWLNTDYPPYVIESLEVSNTALARWTMVWTNPNTAIVDRAWTNVAYNISALADGKTNVFIRWGHRIAQSGAYAYSGWNIDDIELLGTPTRLLTVSVPATATEGNGVLPGAGHVYLSASVPTNLVVMLTSSDTTEATVPTSVTVLAGQTNADFDITIIDDGVFDGTQTATITAAAPGFASGRSTISVYDNEAATLQVLLPASVSEGAGTIQGTVTANLIPTANIPVSLSSSDSTQLQVPASVILTAGQTSAVFNVTVIDDTLFNGSRNVSVTAHVPGSTDGVATILLLDNETTNLVITLPASVTEGDGVLANAGQVRLAGTLPTNLVVSLASSKPSEADVPATATIAAGQFAASFDLTIGHDPAVTGDQTVSISASAPGFANGAGTLLVRDYESPPPATNPTPADLTTNIAANTSLSWSGPSGDVTNDIYLGTHADLGAADLQGSTTTLSWTPGLLAPNTLYYWKVVSRRAGATSSAVWRFTTRGVARYVWGDIPSPQWQNLPFSVTVTAQDELGRTVSNFPGPVNLSGWAGSSLGTNTMLGGPAPSGNAAGNYTLAFGFTPNTNLTVTHVRSCSGTKVSLWTAGGTLVFTQNVSGPAGVWTDTALPAPVSLSAGVAYRVGFYTAGGTYYYYTNRPTTFPNGTLVNGYYYTTGDGFPATFYSGTRQVYLCDLRYTVGTTVAVPISPTSSGPFVNGAWTGDLTVQQTANSMNLRADDAAGHSGSSLNFTVSLQNDLSLAVVGSPNPVALGDTWTNTLFLTNTGPAAATSVFVTNTCPAGASFVSAAADQGTFAVVGQTVVFNVGTVASQTAIGLQVIVAPSGVGALTNTAVVTRGEFDGDPSNNSAVTTTLVQAPQLSINNINVLEGDSNLTRAIFTVQLAPPTPNEVIVNYTTVDGTALAGSDYVARFGELKFAPYATTQNILIYVYGDTNIEPDETFSVVLTNPVNASLAAAVGTCTIVNDDTREPSVAYLRSTVSLPWGSSDNEWALNRVFGTNWMDLRYETVSNLATLFSPTKRFIFMEGSDSGALEMGLFLTNNLPAISNWVAAGGSLFLNAAPNEGGNIYFGFGVLLHNSDFASSEAAMNLSHPIFNGPYMPAGLPAGSNYTGSYFCHGSVTGPGLSGLLIDPITAHLGLAEGAFGAGHLLVGGMTLPVFHQPQPQSSNLLANILFYGGHAAGLGTNTAPIIINQPASLSVLAGSSPTFSVTAFGTLPLAYSWRCNGSPIAGATDWTFTTNNVPLSASGSVFSCLITNAFGSVLSSNAVLTVSNGIAPAIVQQPADVLVTVGGTASFHVTATGTAPLAYFWQRNGVPISGATSSYYSFFNAQSVDSGSQFSCLVSNAFGSALSSNATLTVTTPPNQVFLSGNYLYLPININGVFIANNTGGKYNAAGTGGATGVDFWFPGTPVYNYDIGVDGVNYLNGSFLSLTITNVSSAGVQRALLGATVTASLHFTRDISFATNSKAIKIIDTLQNTGASTLNNLVTLDSTDPDQDSSWTYATLNDVVSIGMPNDLVVATGPNTGLSLGLGSDSGTQVPSATGFQNTNAYNYLTVVDPNGVSADIAINLAQNYGSLAPGGSKSVIWYMVFGSSKAEVTNLFAQLVITNAPPVILNQPISVSVVESSSASFSVNAIGTPPLAYSWRCNGTSIPGATGSSFTTNNVVLAASGSVFSCLVSNAFGSVLSSNAVLTVSPGIPPAFTSQPANVTVISGNAATFTVSATGTAPLRYFWQRNATPIAGATASYYSLIAQIGDSGSQFSCLVSNAFGTALSSNATLTVVSPPNQVFLVGNYLYLPLNTNGVFIAANTGAKYNAAGTGGTLGVDFWFPGTPVYNYSVAVGGSNYSNGRFLSLTITNASDAGTQRAVLDAAVNPSLTFTRELSFATNSKAIKVVDTLQNISALTLNDVRTLDSTDPDQDYVATGTYETLNDVVSIGLPNDMVVASGPSTGLSVGFGSDSGLQVPSATGFNNTNAYLYTNVVDPNGVSADIAINLDQNYGSLAPGQSKSVTWYMVFGSSKTEVTNAFALLVGTNLPPAALDHFSWANIASPQIAGVPFGVTLSALDVSNVLVTTFTGPASLSAWAGSYPLTNEMFNGVGIGSTSTGTYTWGFPFSPATNLVATHFRHMFGSKVSLWTTNGVLLASQNVVSTNGVWVETPLTSPVPLTAGSNYVIAAYVNANSYYWVSSIAGAFADGTVGTSLYTAADAFPTSQDAGAWPLVGLRYVTTGSVSIPLSPANTGSFSNGVWTGTITVGQTASNVVLTASDGLGHAGLSNPFMVNAGMNFGRIWLAGAGEAHFELAGRVGDVYTILSSTNLTDWQPLCTITNLTGVLSFSDPGATNFQRRFYRCTLQPQ